MQHHLQTAAHGSGLFWLLSLLLILLNWTVYHQIWCAGKQFLGSLGRYTVEAWKRRFQTVWVLGHILVSLHWWSLKGWDEVQSKLIVLWVFSWKDDTILRSVGGHPIFFRIVNNLSLLTKSKALVRSMKAMYSGLCCSLHFSCSCLREKTMSIGWPSCSETVLWFRVDASGQYL